MIRKFSETDLDKVMSIWFDSNIEAHSFIPKSYWELVSHFAKTAIVKSELYVYEEDGNICGFIGLEDSYIAGMFVEETKRSKGIGRNLLDYVKTIRTELDLRVYQNNERAIAFYQREQFIAVAESVDENTNEAEFVMRWEQNERS